MRVAGFLETLVNVYPKHAATSTPIAIFTIMRKLSFTINLKPKKIA
jgi:hypothetical protein